jgi:S-methylmethionine-dependent homocysteine/selenocysteine methylase
MNHYADNIKSRDVLPVSRLSEAQVSRAVAVLCDAFREYPVMRYVIGPDDGDYDRHLHTLLNFFVMARVWRDEPILGVSDGSDLVATAILTLPGKRQPPTELAQLREAVWRELGQSARMRYEALGEARRKFDISQPHYHLNMIGVRRSRHGQGLSRQLLDAVHTMSRRDPVSHGVTLTTENFRTYATIAKDYEVGFILEAPTWRANPDWFMKLGYTNGAVAEVNRQSIAMLRDIRSEFENEKTQMVISGCIGPRGDGYLPASAMTEAEAQRYHLEQISTFSDTGADMVTAITMNYVEEAIGISSAARSVGMPVAISFTVETDGKLPTGQTLKAAIEKVDEATDNAPVYYMINCAHPTHFESTLAVGEPWVERIRGLRANASTKSHAELNESTELDEGNPEELGRQHRQLLSKMKNLNVLGGCCGTDHRHVEEICKSVLLQQ